MASLRSTAASTSFTNWEKPWSNAGLDVLSQQCLTRMWWRMMSSWCLIGNASSMISWRRWLDYRTFTMVNNSKHSFVQRIWILACSSANGPSLSTKISSSSTRVASANWKVSKSIRTLPTRSSALQHSFEPARLNFLPTSKWPNRWLFLGKIMTRDSLVCTVGFFQNTKRHVCSSMSTGENS